MTSFKKNYLPYRYSMAIINYPEQGLEQLAHITSSSFCRRRLSTILVTLKFVPTLIEAIKYIEQGRK